VKWLERVFGHKHDWNIIMEPSIVTGYPMHVGSKCRSCGAKEITAAGHQQKYHKENTPEGCHWEHDSRLGSYGGWKLVEDSID
jgi:hypothetical protein